MEVVRPVGGPGLRLDAALASSGRTGPSRPSLPARAAWSASPPEEALRLLGTVPLGRLVFTRQALPTTRPVNHVIDRGDIVIRTHEDTALLARPAKPAARGGGRLRGDDIDVVTRLGWSVVVTGYCHLVTDPAEVARCQALVQPWLDHPMDHVVRIRPGLITGMRLADATLPRPGDATGR
ncbi:pyridoxamine 5'-phosphate oxidase family protein [Streptomyces sp. NPDC001107]